MQTDQWSLIQTENGIQLKKNGENYMFFRTLAQAIKQLEKVSTMGDTVSLIIDSVQIENLYS